MSELGFRAKILTKADREAAELQGVTAIAKYCGARLQGGGSGEYISFIPVSLKEDGSFVHANKGPVYLYREVVGRTKLDFLVNTKEGTVREPQQEYINVSVASRDGQTSQARVSVGSANFTQLNAAHFGRDVTDADVVEHVLNKIATSNARTDAVRAQKAVEQVQTR